MNEWLTPIVDAYKQYFNDSPVVVWEVGSRDGRDGVELAERLGGGKVVCMEPNPEQAKLIKKTYPSVQVVRLAASDKNGVADFIVYEGDEGAVGSSSLNLNWKEDDLQGHIIKVQTVRLETLIFETIDVMKIDVEGYSLQALKGLGEKINKIRVLHVETEEWTKSDKKVKAYLNDWGWQLYDERQEWPGMPDQTWINANLVGYS